MELPKNEEEKKKFLLARAEQIDNERPEWTKGVAYLNGFHDGMAYAINSMKEESKKSLLEMFAGFLK